MSICHSLFLMICTRSWPLAYLFDNMIVWEYSELIESLSFNQSIDQSTNFLSWLTLRLLFAVRYVWLPEKCYETTQHFRSEQTASQCLKFILPFTMCASSKSLIVSVCGTSLFLWSNFCFSVLCRLVDVTLKCNRRQDEFCYQICKMTSYLHQTI